MIKSLFEPDEHASEKIKTAQEKNAADELETEKTPAPQYVEVNEAENLFDAPEEKFEKPEDSQEILSANELESINTFVETTGNEREFSNAPADSPENLFAETSGETTDPSESPFDSSESSFVEPANERIDFTPPVEPASESNFAETINQHQPAETLSNEPSVEAVTAETSAELKIENSKPADNNDLLFQPLPEPESFAETARKSGLAYAAAITLTASIVFMLVIGWFADLLFGTSPWGIVGGIVLGSLIGFVQFFRMTAQIFKNKE